jgi:glutamate/tyrosine decarboxylase-like PLP-dependent enzyme
MGETPGKARIHRVIELVERMELTLQKDAKVRNRRLPKLAFRRTDDKDFDDLGPKFPSDRFDYLRELDQADLDSRLDLDSVLAEVARFFRGAIRPESARSLFNMIPEPSEVATAASWMVTLHNCSGLMDMFGGESLLVEQQIARAIGRWIGWPAAMGISCSGGKATLMYGIRAAVSRAAPESRKTGIPGNLALVCSAGAHYSVEHTATLLGVGSSNCHRVPCEANGSMSESALIATLQDLHDRGLVVAAVICCGGTTIDFHCDDTETVARVVDDFVTHNTLERRPYLHLDSVIGWLYLTLRGESAENLRRRAGNAAIANRIEKVLGRFESINKFDSCGVDFHKNGMCPFPGSFFVARNRAFMDELGDGSYLYSDQDLTFGEFRAYRFTLENSRPTQGILAAWVNMRLVGRAGLGDHLLDLHRAREAACAALRRHGSFRILNAESCGWEVVFDIPLSVAFKGKADLMYQSFVRECWERVAQGHILPLFSIVPGYRSVEAADECGAFLIYPMRQLTDREWDEIVSEIALQWEDFERRLVNHPGIPLVHNLAKPIR